jgi:hypothetical protein
MNCCGLYIIWYLLKALNSLQDFQWLLLRYLKFKPCAEPPRLTVLQIWGWNINSGVQSKINVHHIVNKVEIQCIFIWQCGIRCFCFVLQNWDFSRQKIIDFFFWKNEIYWILPILIFHQALIMFIQNYSFSCFIIMNSH